MQRLIILLAAVMALALMAACADTWRPDPSRDIQSTQATIEAKAAAYRESLPGTITPAPTTPTPVPTPTPAMWWGVKNNPVLIDDLAREHRDGEPFILHGCTTAVSIHDRDGTVFWNGQPGMSPLPRLVVVLGDAPFMVGRCYDMAVRFVEMAGMEGFILSGGGPSMTSMTRSPHTHIFRLIGPSAFERSLNRSLDLPETRR